MHLKFLTRCIISIQQASELGRLQVAYRESVMVVVLLQVTTIVGNITFYKGDD